MKKIWGLLLLIAWLVGCASDECADGKCDEEVTVVWGTSRMLALEPSTGEQRWGVDFQGQTIDIRRLQDDGQSVVVAVDDPCFETERVFAFAVNADDPIEVELDTETQEVPDADLCADVVLAATTNFQYLNGFCVGRNPNNGDLVAVDPTNNEEVWRSEMGVFNHYVYGNILMAEAQVTISTLVRYRLYRVAVANGGTIWQYEQAVRMEPIGANDEFIFMLDTRPFALNAATGDMGWRNDEQWNFVPLRDGGVLLGDTLFVKRQYFINSTCVDTDDPSSL